MANLPAEMAPLRVPINLPELVKSAFERAKANGDVNYYPTQVALLQPHSIPFQLRFSPSLANKPKGPKPDSASKKPFNPFENPSPQLLIAPLPPAHALVLNKFAIVPEHFILITKAFRPQTHLLEADDLAAAYACIDAYHAYGGSTSAGEEGSSGPQELFAFFNSGQHSGASQPHRHLQLLPVARMRDGLEASGGGGGGGWDVLAERLADAAQRARLPFATFAEPIGPGLAPVDLRAAYLRLYRQAREAAGEAEDVGGDGETTVSYNMAMTRDVLVVCPRASEGGAVVGADGREAGQLALNGTVLAGTALVKSEAEWDALRDDPGQLWEVLEKIGLPPAGGDGDRGQDTI